MNHYKLQKLIPGYKIKPSLRGKTLVALPFKVKEPTVITYKEESIHLNKESVLLYEQMFDDKFGRNKTYTLYYYEYITGKPTNQISLF